MRGSDQQSTHRARGERLRRLRVFALGAVSILFLGPLVVLGSASVASATAPGPETCGTGALPAGTYTSLNVTGTCTVSAGPVTVLGNVTVEPNAALLSAYGTGNSSLTVVGNVAAATGSTVVLGCEASNFPCFDDPNQNAPTLNSSDTVEGSVTATSALAVIVHKSTVDGDIAQTGGGGGLSCSPPFPSPFSQFQSPVYSDYEDNTVGGNLRVTDLTSCWFGALRNTVGGSATFSNNSMGDPDANENLTNLVSGNLICSNNSPAIQFGDSMGMSNVVDGFSTGECAFGVDRPNPAPAGTPTPIAVPSGSLPGYWTGAQDGGIFSFGVPFFGSQGGQPLPGPIVGLASAPGGAGYALADANGAVYAHGANATDCTGVSGPLNKPIVAVAAAPGGNGCWLAAADGGIFALGPNAPFFGSAGSLSLNKPVVGIAATPGNDGYDMVATDGGVFTYGPGATFYGSMGGKPLNKPIVGIATDPVTGGYWLVASDGGVFSFNAPFFGSMGGKPLNKPIVGIAAAPTGDGYYLVASDGGIFAFGTGAHFQGSTGSLKLNQPIVGIALG